MVGAVITYHLHESMHVDICKALGISGMHVVECNTLLLATSTAAAAATPPPRASDMVLPTATRWRPTPDQLLILEELYIGGVKTPSASQIQRITSHLSLYGKIECKNVFYWFQNHKAREKQKLRKKLILGKQLLQQQQQQQQLFTGQSYLHDNVIYFLEQPQFGCGFLQLPPHASFIDFHPQGRVIQTGRPKVTDGTWPRMYKDDDARMTTLTTGVGPTGYPHPPCCATARPLQTLQLFPTSSSRQRPQGGAHRLDIIPHIMQ
ncbi:hypothetical protein Nepgr_016064 [Nepenthes gracilis]|uniref:Homeobox domain-containing protein n=1 Tax=Nepenthes gracilis TaxID=150966 RepID=A0AAD3SM17_NEPGR|nr:hypothetical protein Nepgr_016064 [Nepenthes gracilis]